MRVEALDQERRVGRDKHLAIGNQMPERGRQHALPAGMEMGFGLVEEQQTVGAASR